MQTFPIININIGTTGLLIPYSIGALAYVKKNLNICDYHLTGISGGSFASVILDANISGDKLNPGDKLNELLNNVSNVTNMENLFVGFKEFNENLGGWDVSKV